TARSVRIAPNASFFFSSRRRHTRFSRDWSSDVCSSDLGLEVGSYVGGYLAAVRDHGWTFSGIDVNEAAVRFACSRGLNARVGTLESLDGDERFDAVAIWNCLDQLPEPRAAIAAAHGVLRDGGTFAARIPSGAFYARVREWLATPLGPVGRALLAYNNL